ncbi:MAG: hypothetical protein IJ728_02060 [Selenomonadaceae bacterium]|nr:hypothetical protein [Selenomonadaceae bacterium]
MQDDEIRWKVTDPLGNEIVLYKDTFVEHIIGDHANKDAEVRRLIEDQVKFVLQSPYFIIKDQKNPNRWKYLGLVEVPQEDQKIKTVGIIIEIEKEPFNIITWYARRVMDELVINGGMIYAANKCR